MITANELDLLQTGEQVPDWLDPRTAFTRKGASKPRFDSSNVPADIENPWPPTLWANVRLAGLDLASVGCALVGLLGLFATTTVMYEDEILTASGRMAWMSLFAWLGHRGSRGFGLHDGMHRRISRRL